MSRRSRLVRLLLLGVAAAGAVTSSAAAYGGYVSDGIIGSFTTMEIPSGALRPQILYNSPMSGLAMSPSGELFGVLGAVPGPGPMQLVRIDLFTPSLDVRGPLAIATMHSWSDVGLAFDATGRLWLATAEGKLYQVDSSTGAATLRVDLGIPVEGLAGCGTRLFGLTHPPGEQVPVHVVRIDPYRETFVALGAGTSDVWARDGVGLDFSADGRLWGILRNDSLLSAGLPEDVLAEFDPATGELLSHLIHYASYNGLAIARPPVSCRGVAPADVPSLSRAGLFVLAGMLTLVAAMVLRSRRRPTDS